MSQAEQANFIIRKNDLILITGATGFIGSRLVENLLDRGFCNLRCLCRPTSEVTRLEELSGFYRGRVRVEVVRGNLLSRKDCTVAMEDVAVVFHLATGRDARSFPDAFMNSVITTRNLLEASMQYDCLRRFVNVSSFTVYANKQNARWRLLDETCPIEGDGRLRSDAYCFAKIKQEEIVVEYNRRLGIPYVTVRPGYVYGPGHETITNRVGIDTFGFFLHLGGSNTIPFTYVENCAEAIALAGLIEGIDGEVFNIVDDDLPSSSLFLRLYKRDVKHFRSLYVPHAASYALCYLWERYSEWSRGQVPPVFNCSKWHAFWKKTRYSNERLKMRLGWKPKISTEEWLRRYFESSRNGKGHA